MWCTSWAIRCSRWHCAVQSVVCHQDSTLKLLVAPLHITVQLFASRAVSHCEHDMGTLVVKCGTTQKSTHHRLWQTCKVFYSWALFCETTVYHRQSFLHLQQLTVQMLHQMLINFINNRQLDNWFAANISIFTLTSLPQTLQCSLKLLPSV